MQDVSPQIVSGKIAFSNPLLLRSLIMLQLKPKRQNMEGNVSSFKVHYLFSIKASN